MQHDVCCVFLVPISLNQCDQCDQPCHRSRQCSYSTVQTGSIALIKMSMHGLVQSGLSIEDEFDTNANPRSVWYQVIN